MVYLTLVGTQVMAVLNPLLALIQANRRPLEIKLFHTFRTAEVANRIKKYLVDGLHYADANVELKKVSITLDDDNEGNPSPQKAIMKFPLETCYFNLAGGMNYQIAACIGEMAGECHLLYPESNGIQYFKCNKRTVEEVISFAFPPPIDVLSLQGVSVRIGDKDWKCPPLLNNIKSDCGLNLPLHFIENAVVSDVQFDYIYNIGNELRFLKVIEMVNKNAIKDDEERKRIASKELTDIRAVISLAHDRDRFGELFHRSIIVVTNDSGVAERLRREGGGKINVLRIKHSYNKSGKTDKIGSKICDDLNRYLSSEFSYSTTVPSPKIVETGNATESKGSLHVVLGRDILPTLISIWTHRPKDLILLYTPGSQVIEVHRLAIINNKKFLPVSKITLLPISIVGADILENINMGKAGEVNVTPGTKAQAAFLTMWAKKNGGAVYSLDTLQNKAIEIAGSSSKRISAPDPATLLRLSGVSIKPPGEVEGQTELLKERETYEGILGFIKIATESNVPLKDIPFSGKQGYIEIRNKARFKQKNNNAVIIFADQRPKVTFSTDKGIWFERLIGYCFLKSGADDVNVRIRTLWSESRQKNLDFKYGEKDKDRPFMTDIDVAVRFGATYYVIECKATMKENDEMAIQKAQVDASLFGRFTVPLVAFLKYEGEPDKRNNVYVFGHRTFCDPQALRALTKMAVRERRKTQSED